MPKVKSAVVDLASAIVRNPVFSPPEKRLAICLIQHGEHPVISRDLLYALSRDANIIAGVRDNAHRAADHIKPYSHETKPGNKTIAQPVVDLVYKVIGNKDFSPKDQKTAVRVIAAGEKPSASEGYLTAIVADTAILPGVKYEAIKALNIIGSARAITSIETFNATHPHDASLGAACIREIQSRAFTTPEVKKYA